LFDIKKGVKSKEFRMAKQFVEKNNLSAKLEQGFNAAAEKLAKEALSKLPPLNIGGEEIRLDNPLI
jgi:hypothetical protein